MMNDMAKVTVTLYMDEGDKEALQQLADAEERSLSQMAVLILKRAIKQAEVEGKIQLTEGKQHRWCDAAYLRNETGWFEEMGKCDRHSLLLLSECVLNVKYLQITPQYYSRFALYWISK